MRVCCRRSFPPSQRIMIVALVSLKYQIFHFIVNYAPIDPREQAAFHRPIDAFMTTSCLVILAGDWHAILGIDTDRRI